MFELEYGKIEYAGALPSLYRNDFKKFLQYVQVINSLHSCLLVFIRGSQPKGSEHV